MTKNSFLAEVTFKRMDHIFGSFSVAGNTYKVFSWHLYWQSLFMTFIFTKSFHGIYIGQYRQSLYVCVLLNLRCFLINQRFDLGLAIFGLQCFLWKCWIRLLFCFVFVFVFFIKFVDSLAHKLLELWLLNENYNCS